MPMDQGVGGDLPGRDQGPDLEPAALFSDPFKLVKVLDRDKVKGFRLAFQKLDQKVRPARQDPGLLQLAEELERFS